MTYQVERYHDISVGHRVHQHESKCAHLHGHNYRITFVCESDDLDSIGRVIDFGDIKTRLCMWLEATWDHRFLLHSLDPWLAALRGVDPSVVEVPFNPTAENMAEYLVRTVGPGQLQGTGIRLVRVRVEETRKCSATFEA